MTIYVHLAVQYTHTHKYTIQRHTGRHKVIDTHTDTSIKKGGLDLCSKNDHK